MASGDASTAPTADYTAFPEPPAYPAEDFESTYRSASADRDTAGKNGEARNNTQENDVVASKKIISGLDKIVQGTWGSVSRVAL